MVIARQKKSLHYTMNSKTIIVVLVVLVAMSVVEESHGFTAGGGGVVPSGKREFMTVSRKKVFS